MGKVLGACPVLASELRDRREGWVAGLVASFTKELNLSGKALFLVSFDSRLTSALPRV